MMTRDAIIAILIRHKVAGTFDGLIDELSSLLTSSITILYWQADDGCLDVLGLFTTRDRAVLASYGLATGFVLWGEHTSNLVEYNGSQGRFWLDEMTVNKVDALEGATT